MNAIDNFLIGIYKITNTINNKCYVGKSVNVRQRLKQHYRELSKDGHCNYLLQHDFNLYGESSFVVEVLYECKEGELDDFESYFCHKNNVWVAGYNIAKLKFTNIKTKTKQEKFRSEFVDYLCNLTNLVEAVNESPKDLLIDLWRIAESSGLDNKKLRWCINTMTPEELKRLPFVIEIESFGFGKVFVSFRSKKRQADENMYLSAKLDALN